jgi:DNA polymerase I-like protein with 3'-5' exonuclease and polymerase domains
MEIFLVSKQYELFPGEVSCISVEKSLEMLNPLDELAVDTETTGLDCHIDELLLLQLGNENIQIVVDCTTINILHYKELLENKPLILQNAKFDLKFLFKVDIIPRKHIWDTMLAEQVLYMGLKPSSNLKHLVKKYCQYDMSKEIRSNIPKLGITYDVIVYAAKDIVFLHKIKEYQIIDAKNKKVLKAIGLENQFVPVLAYVEYCGLYLDREKWTNKYEQAKKHLSEKIKELDNYVINNQFIKYIDKQLDLFSTDLRTIINWSSTKQVLPLFKDIGINVFSNENKSGESISEKIIIKQKDLFPIIPIYLEFQTLKKDFTTYGENFLENINKETNRIHSDFKQLMITSRLSSSNPNLQNLPRDKRTRSCFTNSNENTTLVVADYDGQEDKVFVNRSKEKKMIEFYQGEFSDGHSFTAKMCFPEELKDIELKNIKKERPDLRYLAKTAKFAIHYSGTGFTIANNLNLSEEEGNRIYDAYMKAFPDIAKYLKSQQNKAKKLGYILTSTVTGRKVWCKDFQILKNNNEYKKIYEFAKLACNYPIQNESAEITKIAGIKFFKWILENNLFKTVKISNLVHDEIMVECPKHMAEEISVKLKESMEVAGNYFCKIIPLTATPEITNYWTH